MFLLDTLLINGIQFVLDKVATIADQELNDPERQRERLLTRTRTVIWCAANLPLRAAAIFAPLSSRTEAPRTTISHSVARKARVPRGAIIASILLWSAKPSRT